MESQREIRQSGYMTETEALMWAAERDQRLSSAMGSLFVLDAPLDVERLVAQMADASRTFLRLRECVDEGLHLTTPRWVVEPDFDVRDHVTERRLPAPGGLGELLRMTAEVMNTPFDRTRPLWQFVAVVGSGSGGDDAIAGALIIKMHHSVTDGIGAVRLAEMYLDIERDPADRDTASEASNDELLVEPDQVGLRSDVGHVVRRQLGLARRVAGEVALWGADRGRIQKRISDVGFTAKSLVGQTGTGEPGGGSPMWRNRSDQRHLEVFDLDLEVVRAGAKGMGGTINDLFVTGSVMAAIRYHARAEVEVDTFNLSFILSTRADNAAGGNSFAPVSLAIDASPRSPAVLFSDVKAAMAESRSQAQEGSSELMEVALGFMSAMPGSFVSRAGRARAARLDFATSNLRAAPFTLFVGGAEITHMYPVGPLVGTAWNLTAMSYDGMLHMGLFVDPEAVDEPEKLREDLRAAYHELIESGE